MFKISETWARQPFHLEHDIGQKTKFSGEEKNNLLSSEYIYDKSHL